MKEKIRMVISHNVKYAKVDDLVSALKTLSSAGLGFPVMVYVKGVKVSVDEDKDIKSRYVFELAALMILSGFWKLIRKPLLH